jgi:RNA polymerase sigma factor (sigma-70 family)
MKNESLTPEDFDRLLQWLDSNPNQAVLKYEKTRVRLITFFAGGGCGCDAERLADEAFDRVCQKLRVSEVSESYEGDKSFYFLGFARNIRHEYYRERQLDELPVQVVDPDENKNDPEAEEELECLDQCIDELPNEKRTLVIEYYLFEKAEKIDHHKKMAIQLGIDIRTLRLRVHRTREQLRPCIEACMSRSRVVH